MESWFALNFLPCFWICLHSLFCSWFHVVWTQNSISNFYLRFCVQNNMYAVVCACVERHTLAVSFEEKVGKVPPLFCQYMRYLLGECSLEAWRNHSPLEATFLLLKKGGKEKNSFVSSYICLAIVLLQWFPSIYMEIGNPSIYGGGSKATVQSPESHHNQQQKGLFSTYWAALASREPWRHFCRAPQASRCVKIAIRTNFRFCNWKVEVGSDSYFYTFEAWRALPTGLPAHTPQRLALAQVHWKIPILSPAVAPSWGSHHYFPPLSLF